MTIAFGIMVMGVITTIIWRFSAILVALAALALTSGFVLTLRLSLAPLGNLAIYDQTLFA